MRLTSPAFKDGQPIPALHTCDGHDVSPELHISDVPESARFLALIFDDPDAPHGTWTHWTWWDLPVTRMIAAGARLPHLGATEGTTSNGGIGYHGPCPPPGTHNYVFHLFALADPIGLPRGAPVAKVWEAVEDHVARTRLMGTYSRLPART